MINQPEIWKLHGASQDTIHRGDIVLVHKPGPRIPLQVYRASEKVAASPLDSVLAFQLPAPRTSFYFLANALTSADPYGRVEVTFRSDKPAFLFLGPVRGMRLFSTPTVQKAFSSFQAFPPRQYSCQKRIDSR